MARERTIDDHRFKEVREILEKERPNDSEEVFNAVTQNLSILVDGDDREPLSKYLDENPTIGRVLTTERVELGEDTRRNPKTIMSYMREIFEGYKKRRETSNN